MDTASFLVTGGCGLQGSHIVDKLRQKHPRASVAVMTRNPVEHFSGVQYIKGNVTSADDVQRVYSACKPTIVFHCAGVMTIGRKPQPESVVRGINFDGARLCLNEAMRTGVKVFVFTSSASVIQRENGGLMELKDADESYPTVQEDDKITIYPKAKAAGERLVLAANDPNGIRTCSLRPALIYGERDNDVIPMLMATLKAGRNKVQIGDNSNLFGATYAGNGADAHLLAAAKLLSPSPEGVAGEAFFITNGQDQPFWTFNRAAWRAAGDTTQLSEVRIISQFWADWAAWASEWIAWFRGSRPALSSAMVYMSTRNRYFNITKARERLGYSPDVEWEDGLKRGVQWYLENQKGL